MVTVQIIARNCNTMLRPNQVNPIVYACRNVGAYKRPVLIQVNTELEQLKEEVFKNRVSIESFEWKKFRNNLILNNRFVNLSNIDAVILGNCNHGTDLPIARSYVEYLEKEGIQPNVATLGRLLKVYYQKYKTNGNLCENDKTKILQIYSNIREKYDTLDATTCENLIYGLVSTDRWKDSLTILDMIKLTAIPSYRTYSAVITKAFNVQEIEIGWKVLEEALDYQKQPACDVFIAYINSISKDKETFVYEMEKLLEIISKYEIVISVLVANLMVDILSKLKATASKTLLNPRGECQTCGVSMQNVAISETEFNLLSSSFLQKVLIRKDVFQKSSPEEVDRFVKFVDQTAPYDCVIDGLNVAYSFGTKKDYSNYANLLSSVVKYFKDKGKHILVLGKEHMNKWPKENITFIKKNACTFFANNLTQDDPFILYATLKSGQSADFFSRDLMRPHAHLLGSNLKSVFKRWRQEHQYSLITQTHTGKILVKEPIRYNIHAHKTNSVWHIPFKQDYTQNPAENFEVPESWLCIQLSCA